MYLLGYQAGRFATDYADAFEHREADVEHYLDIKSQLAIWDQRAKAFRGTWLRD